MSADADVIVTGDAPMFMPRDAIVPVDVGGGDASSRELCNNGIDDDGDRRTDEGCPCVPGSTQRCYAGSAMHAGVGACVLGSMRCEGIGEFGTWGLCVGSVLSVGDACDGVDNDCDGTVDDNCACRLGERGPCYTGAIGTRSVGVCRDGVQTCTNFAGGFGTIWSNCAGEVRPGRETCDGVDNDCNGTVDDGCACTVGSTRMCYGGPTGTSGVGACRQGRQSCGSVGGNPAWGACAGQVLPAAEVCGDGVDNNCNGRVDDGCECVLRAMRTCYAGPAAARGVGTCRDGTQTCIAGPSGGTTWGPCAGSGLPASELCDGLDNDCNRATDEGCVCRPGATQSCYSGPSGTSGRGICRAGSQTCTAGPRGIGSAWASCAGQTLPGTEVCNRLDDDCDGMIDDGLSCVGPSVRCPAPVTAPAGSTVTLNAMVTGSGTYLWEMVSAPPGAIYTIGTPNAPTTTFRSVIVGTFTLRFTVTDSMGRAASCDVTVTMQGHGLRVEMQWDTDGNDIDLHVHNAAAPVWFDALNDCFFRNRMPEWDAPGILDNPALDTDDTNGRGPENIRVDEPPSSQVYTVGVHYWSGSVPTNVTVRVYCGDRLAAPAFVRSLLNGPDPLSNEFWRVARVQFSSPSTCAVTPIGDVITAGAARMGSP